MATPQYATMIVALGSPNGARKAYRMYASDAAGPLTYPSGSSEEVLHGAQNVYVVDWFTATALATMVSLTPYVGGMTSTMVIDCATNIATVEGGRMLQQAPLLVPAGQSLRLVQA